MPKKFPNTATSGKRKRTQRKTNNSEPKEGDEAHSDMLDQEEPRRKEQRSEERTIYSRTSTQTSLPASTHNQVPITATGVKRKRSQCDKNDSQQKGGYEVNLDTQDKDEPSRKQRKSYELTISETSTKTTLQASSSSQNPTEGKFTNF